MIGYVTMGMAIVPMIGPALGGALDAAFGWHASFWALFILGAFALTMAWLDLGETAPLSGRTLRQQIQSLPDVPNFLAAVEEFFELAIAERDQQAA